jgi:hypothetical protein
MENHGPHKSAIVNIDKISDCDDENSRDEKNDFRIYFLAKESHHADINKNCPQKDTEVLDDQCKQINGRNAPKEYRCKPCNLRNTPHQPPSNALMGFVYLVLPIEYDSLDHVCDAQDKEKCANVKVHEFSLSSPFTPCKPASDRLHRRVLAAH